MQKIGTPTEIKPRPGKEEIAISYIGMEVSL